MERSARESCECCGQGFTVESSQQRIMEKVFSPDLPLPAVRSCPACRMRQRLSFRNERHLYRRSCALSGKPVISVYRPDAPFTVYDQAIWWSDQYDPFAYGRPIDFTRPFFEQLDELHCEVPKLCIHNAKSENCDYTNYSAENRNCYLVVGGLEAEDCYYSYRVFYSKNIVDSFAISRSELCYECVQGADLYGCLYAVNCSNSSGLVLCEDCQGCQDCIGCVNLQGKRHHIFNEPYSAAEYEAQKTLLLADVHQVRTRYAALRANLPYRATYTLNCETSSGDQLRGCRRCHDGFFLAECEDVLHARNGEGNRDCCDVNFGDNCELQYEASNLEKNYRVAFAALAWYVSESFYVLSCFNSKYLFGCCGMKRGEYCILNQPYSPSEYRQNVERLARHMVETNEWGRFFPPTMSPFLFHETVAHELFPLPEEEQGRLGFQSGRAEAAAGGAVPDDALRCASCSRAFRVLPQEQRFYDSLALPRPSCCPDCRHTARMKLRRPMQIASAVCSACGDTIPSTLQVANIFCESCFVSSRQ